MAGDCGERGCVFVQGLDLDYGLMGELEAEQMISELCSEGCPVCKRPMLREGRFKCSCSTCGVGLELIPPGASRN
jgi:hypothetical protein